MLAQAMLYIFVALGVMAVAGCWLACVPVQAVLLGLCGDAAGRRCSCHACPAPFLFVGLGDFPPPLKAFEVRLRPASPLASGEARGHARERAAACCMLWPVGLAGRYGSSRGASGGMTVGVCAAENASNNERQLLVGHSVAKHTGQLNRNRDPKTNPSAYQRIPHSRFPQEQAPTFAPALGRHLY